MIIYIFYKYALKGLLNKKTALKERRFSLQL